MKYSIIRLLLVAAAGMFIIPGMNGQGLKTLENNNGFKHYKLKSRYTSVYGMKYKDPGGADKVVVNYTEEKIGDIPVRKIELYYLNDTLAKIKVDILPYNYEKLLNACQSNFGTPTADLSVNNKSLQKDSSLQIAGNTFLDRYQWKASKLTLEYNYIYPKISSDPYSVKELFLVYSLRDYDARLKRAGTRKYSRTDF